MAIIQPFILSPMYYNSLNKVLSADFCFFFITISPVPNTVSTQKKVFNK